MAKFRNVEFTMSMASGYGSYYIHATYKGKDLKVMTHDSEAWDWWNDDSNKVKHMDAKRHCYTMIVLEYERLYGK
jgi:hypothetical protein